jgi:hypothetical protein
MIFTYRLVIGRTGEDSYDDAWCYADLDSALETLLFWNPFDAATPEPSGWIKHPSSGRTQAPGKERRDEDHDRID